MSTRARLARLESRQCAGGDASDQEHLRLGAAIVVAMYRGDHDAVAALQAQIACLPPPTPGGGLDTTLRYAAGLGYFDADPDDRAPELPECQSRIAAHPSTAAATPSVVCCASAHDSAGAPLDPGAVHTPVDHDHRIDVQ